MYTHPLRSYPQTLANLFLQKWFSKIFNKMVWGPNCRGYFLFPLKCVPPFQLITEQTSLEVLPSSDMWTDKTLSLNSCPASTNHCHKGRIGWVARINKKKNSLYDIRIKWLYQPNHLELWRADSSLWTQVFSVRCLDSVCLAFTTKIKYFRFESI